LNDTPINRSDILLSLWRDHERLEQLRDDIHTAKKDVCPKWRFEVYIIQVKAQLANIALDVLEESDLDVLKREIEEIKKRLR
jgi:hypothetical protein